MRLSRVYWPAWLPVFWLAGALLPAQTVLLNEMQTANTTTLRDENGDTADWLELYNPGPTAVDLSGWGLSDSAANLFKWRFAQASIAPGG